jgi:hypothetical protein
LRLKGVTPPLKARLLGLLVRPDLIDLDLNLIYEIKAVRAQFEARLQQLGYLYLLTIYDFKDHWFFGNSATYNPVSSFSLTVIGYGIDVEVYPPDSFGVITYDWNFTLPKLKPPPPTLVISLFIAAVFTVILFRLNLNTGRGGYAY